MPKPDPKGPPKPDLRPGVLDTAPPRPQDPESYFVLSWIHREMAKAFARCNREPEPKFDPMPARKP